MTHHDREAVGNVFNPALMHHARAKSWDALNAISERMHPGIREDEAIAMAGEVFRDLGMQRLWHPPYIRIGPNTLKTYRERSIPDVQLAENDIYFVDLGLVFEGHEGDVGDTFVVGEAPKYTACAQAARDLYRDVAAKWRNEGLSGRNLYNYADERAEAMGWRFNHAIKGHRISDFPHSVHKGGDLGDLEHSPSSDLWVLEIQIAHPNEPFGAFYEDLLTGAAPVGARQLSETPDTH
jgi:Xaa-Pro aminopeptidase